MCFNTGMRSTLRIVLVVMLAIALGRPVLAAGERWYIVEIDGAKAGWAREVEREEGGVITSESEMRFELKRMGQDFAVAMETRFVETIRGEPVEMTSIQSLGRQEVRETWTFIAGNEVRQVSESAGRRTEKTVPRPEGDWLTPAAARRHVLDRMRAGDQTISFTTIDPSAGLATLRITQTFLGRRDVQAAGKSLHALEWQVENSLLPGVTGREFTDDAGEALRQEIDFGGMTLVLLASEKEAAISEFDPPEMMARTLVKPEGAAITNPRAVQRAEYILSLTDGSPIPDLPSVGGQRVERLDAKRLRVRVQQGRTSPDEPAPPISEDPMLASSTMIDASDPEVRNLARQVPFQRQRAASPLSRAAQQRAYAFEAAKFLNAYLDGEGLGIGFATASEVARTRKGDCTEHAVLLAAVLRSERIPARTVSGLVYTEHEKGGVFAYHMWTQVRALWGEGTEWIDVDAAVLPAGREPGVDATHITLATSTMGDGEMINSIAALVGLIGRLKIEVIAVE